MTGSVKRLVSERGFGFIAADNGLEYFFHRSSVDGSFGDMREGDPVVFEPQGPDGPKGPRARSVQLRDSVTA